MTKKACGEWKPIGRELGYTEDELSSIVREPGQTGEEDYYAEMLRRWLDWAPPNHAYPSIPQLSSALRAVGKERMALDLEAGYITLSSNQQPSSDLHAVGIGRGALDLEVGRTAFSYNPQPSSDLPAVGKRRGEYDREWKSCNSSRRRRYCGRAVFVRLLLLFMSLSSIVIMFVLY